MDNLMVVNTLSAQYSDVLYNSGRGIIIGTARHTHTGKKHLQGIHYSSYTIKFHKLPLEGDRG